MSESINPIDYLKSAKDSLALANVLAGDDGMNDAEFLATMARTDQFVDHDGETCGMCHNMIIGATVAREMLAAGEKEDVINKWAAEQQRRWRESKFVKLWQEEDAAGRDPHKAFEAKGWEP